jgi:hypothetical protein
MTIRILTTVLFLAIMGLLVAQRFLAVPPQLPVMVVDVEGEGELVVGSLLRRGEVIETVDEFVEVSIGDNINIWIAAYSRLELHRLFEDELVVRFTKGRMVVDNHGDVPLNIQTNRTNHIVHGDIASFVNYDFLETVNVIPLSGSVQVNVESTGDYLLTPVPLSIHETDPVTFEKLEVNLAAGDAKPFYEWSGILKAQ